MSHFLSPRTPILFGSNLVDLEAHRNTKDRTVRWCLQACCERVKETAKNTFKKCSGCRKVQYCSQKCQVSFVVCQSTLLTFLQVERYIHQICLLVVMVS
jgi:hypothetical protein